MSGEESKMIMGDDGIFRKYNDEFDITIHCETEEEAERVIDKLNRINEINDLMDYRCALTDREFIKSNYGINDIDMQFIHAFSPDHVLRDWREYKQGAADGKSEKK
jgi:hypothetical protein